MNVTLSEQQGEIHADLTVGANIASTQSLQANASLSNRGVQLFGAGFIVTEIEANALLPTQQAASTAPRTHAQAEGAVLPPLPRAGEGWGEGGRTAEHSVIREYRNGRDLTESARNVKVIDLFGLGADEVRKLYPAIYQHVLERVKPERDQNARASRRNNWWLFGETNPKLRDQLRGLPATSPPSKPRNTARSNSSTPASCRTTNSSPSH